jgi:hypothetical protein
MAFSARLQLSVDPRESRAALGRVATRPGENRAAGRD